MLQIMTFIVAAAVCSLLICRCSLEHLDERLSDRLDDDDTSMLEQHAIVFPSEEEAGDVAGVCTVNNGTVLQCIPLSNCDVSEPTNRTASTRTFPKICGWEITEPKVCCNPVIAEPKTKLKLKDPFDKNECAEPVGGSSAIGGEDVPDASKWPFMVAIFIVLEDEKFFLCGGSLISTTIVLSAAHCFVNRIESDTYVVQMGTVEMNPTTNRNSIVEFGVVEVIVHESFFPPAINNDVAILKLAPPGVNNYMDTIRPVCLPDTSVDDSEDFVNVIGWGTKEFGGPSSQILQQVVISVVSNTKCNETYASMTAARTALPKGVTKSQFCAGEVNGTKDACQGDSGGPVVVTGELSSKWTVMGIVSGGIGCGTPGIPGIYTRVSHFVQWIRSKA